MTPEETAKLNELCNPEGKLVLDVGCGDGRYSEYFADKCKAYVGVDADESQIALNSANNNKPNVRYDACNIVNYNPEEKFDIIVLSLALHEIDIKDQGLALRNILDLLAPDGEVIILDPTFDADSFQALWNIAFDELKSYNHDYSVKHSLEVVDKAVAEGICEIVKKDYIEILFSFKTIDEVNEMLVGSDEFKYVKWTEELKNRLYDRVLKFLGTKENIDIYDKLSIIVLKKTRD